MKKIMLSAVLAFGALFAYAQTPEGSAPEISDDYRRSSISMIIMDDPGMPNREVILETFLSTPIPDKYNDHNIAQRSFDPTELTLTSEDRIAYRNAANIGNTETASGEAPKRKGRFGSILKSAASVGMAIVTDKEQSAVVDNTDQEAVAALAHKHLLEQRVAKQLFDKWFLDENGNFSMELVQQRGLYDATMMDVETAKNSVRGMGILEDAGEELINNTFVVVSRYRFMSKEELVEEIGTMAALVGSQFGGYGELAAMGGTAALQASLGDGYYVRTRSMLFQLRWNDDVANTLYADLWDNPEKYHASDLFEVKYIGEETAWAGTKASIFTNMSRDEQIRVATVNATDAVLAKLERKYDVFKTKTPLSGVEPLTASIGMKEGVEAGDRYEVLEKMVDNETGRTTYQRRGTLTVAKDGVWDNRYMAAEERELTGEAQTLTATRFEGSANNLYPGMLLRQIR